jgi:hypothetical protein
MGRNVGAWVDGENRDAAIRLNGFLGPVTALSGSGARRARAGELTVVNIPDDARFVLCAGRRRAGSAARPGATQSLSGPLTGTGGERTVGCFVQDILPDFGEWLVAAK